jgi:hypothetical protein
MVLPIIILFYGSSNVCVGRYYDRIEYLGTYDWYSKPHREAISNANRDYSNSLFYAKNMGDNEGSRMAIAIANRDFIDIVIEITKNCSDTMNIMCQNESRQEPKSNSQITNDVMHMYFVVSVFLFMFVMVSSLILRNVGCKNNNKEQLLL